MTDFPTETAPLAAATHAIPIHGTVAAGRPGDDGHQTDRCVIVDPETLRMPRGPRTFALRVRGDSMLGAGILPGDVVILEFREPRNGEIVSALIDGETTLKRYLVLCGKSYLKAENPAYPDLIPAWELVIQGVQVALLRMLKT